MPNLILIENSSMFSGYRYDDAAWILGLVFKNGKEFEYLDVGPEVVDEFKAAKSAGTFYNASIKGVYDSRDVTKVPEGESVKEQLRASVVDDTMISDEDIRLAHPNYKAEEVGVAFPMPPVEPEILSPEQALAVMAPKNPKVDELTRRAHALAGKVFSVTDAASQKAVEDHLVQLATVRKALFEIIDPYREIAYRAYEAVQQLNKSRMSPIDEALTTNKSILGSYLRAEREKAEAEQRRLDAEARAKAEEEQRQRTEQMRLEAAEQKQAAGDTAGAEATLFDEAIVAPPVYTPPVRVEQPKSSLGKGRENWKAEVTDLEEVILDVAAGIQSMRAGGNLQGHLPTALLSVNPSILKNLATTNKKMFKFPGLRAWDDTVIAVRTAKE